MHFNCTETHLQKNRDIFIKNWIKKYRTIEKYGKLKELNDKEMYILAHSPPEYLQSLLFTSAIEKWNEMFFVRF
jgi:hypothetical protein